jgi:GNAT superfamily N-acetyltransferase
MPFGRLWRIGVVDAGGELVAMASVASDFLAEGVWLLGFFLVASMLHGTGTSQALHAALESWMAGNGARWIRLAVVVGNARAERFWERTGYREVRRRHDEEMGERVNSVRIMVKPLAGGGPQEYLALVARDRPDPA